jgi:tetratricopeptide (TPR) repeat protein
MSDSSATDDPSENGAHQKLREAVDGGQPGAALQLADVMRQDGDARSAEELYLLAADRNESGAMVHLGDMKRGVDNIGAERAYREALARDEFEAAVRLGDVMRVEGRLGAAEDAYRTAFEHGDAEGRKRLGDVLAQLKRFDEAIALYEEGLLRGEFEMAVRLGDVLKEIGDFARAEEMYRRAIDRGDPEANTRLGDVLASRGLFAEAMTAYERGAKTGDLNAASRVDEIRGDLEPSDYAGPQPVGQTWLALGRLAHHEGWVHDGAFDPGGRLLASAGDDGLWLWDIAGGDDQRAVMLHRGRAWACAFSPVGRPLACAADDGLYLWDITSGVERAGPTIVREDRVWACAFSPDGGLLASAGEQGLWLSRIIGPRSVAGDGTQQTLPASAVGGCAFSPDGLLLASAGDDGVQLWDLATNTKLANLTGGRPAKGDCAFSADGLLANVSEHGMQLWDVRTGRLLVQANESVGLGGCAFSHDGRWLANGGNDGLRLWNVDRAIRLGSLQRPRLVGNHKATGGCRFSADGQMLLSTGEDGVWLWRDARAPHLDVGSASPEIGDYRESSEALPGIAPDVADGEDRLNIAADVRAIANVVAAEGPVPPLSIGLFGDWGSGKSFFIRKVQERVRELANFSRDTEGSAYCGYVRNITFNAWHYADANLWASLVTHIFDELSKSDPDAGVPDDATAAAQLARLEARLAENSALRERLERARGHRRQVEARRNLLRLTWKLTGVEGEQSLGELQQNVRSIGSAVGLLLPNARARLVFLAIALLAAIAVFWTVVFAGGGLLLQGLAASAAAIAVPVGALQLLRKRVLKLLKQAGNAARAIDVRETDIDAELELASAAEQELQRELSDLSAGRRLARVAVERSEDYREHLGLVSRIHDDFVRMSDLLHDESETRRRGPEVDGGGAIKDGEHDDLPKIDRIVLYIDDLDRCPPRRVIQVLEAVHLILAVPLFVVIIAVDPRWLLQSLKFHYAETLVSAAPQGEFPQGELAQNDADSWGASPLDYLEKIIQLPFTLRPMDVNAAGALVHGLMRDPVAAETALTPGAPTNKQPPSIAGDDPSVVLPPVRPQEREQLPSTPGQAGTEPALNASPAPDFELESHPPSESMPDASADSLPVAERLNLSSRPILLTDAECDFAAMVAARFRTPRTVKKFTNLYRLLRAGLDERSGKLDAFLSQDGNDAPEYQAALILLAAVIAFPEDASGLLIDLIRIDGGRQTWIEYLRGLEDPVATSDLRGFLEAASKSQKSSHWTCEPFQRWALEVSRYSFITGQEVFANVSVLQEQRDPQAVDAAVCDPGATVP